MPVNAAQETARWSLANRSPRCSRRKMRTRRLGTLADVDGELVVEVGGQRYEFLPVDDDLAVEVGALVGVGEVLRLERSVPAPWHGA